MDVAAGPVALKRPPFVRLNLVPQKSVIQARTKNAKLRFCGPETTRWSGGLPCEGVVVNNFVPSLESSFHRVSEGRDLGCPGNFVRMSQGSGGSQKVCARKGLCSCSLPICKPSDYLISTSTPDYASNWGQPVLESHDVFRWFWTFPVAIARACLQSDANYCNTGKEKQE